MGCTGGQTICGRGAVGCTGITKSCDLYDLTGLRIYQKFQKFSVYMMVLWHRQRATCEGGMKVLFSSINYRARLNLKDEKDFKYTYMMGLLIWRITNFGPVLATLIPSKAGIYSGSSDNWCNVMVNTRNTESQYSALQTQPVANFEKKKTISVPLVDLLVDFLL